MTNYFEFFGLPVSPSIDEPQLKRTFYANSRRFHPDFHTLASAGVQDDALVQSTLNNEAYKTLADPDRRLKHLLELRGVLGAEGTNNVPQDFLMEIMEVNEALMELEFDDDPLARQKVTGLIEQLEAGLDADYRTLADEYAERQDDGAILSGLRDYYLKKRYLLRLRENV